MHFVRSSFIIPNFASRDNSQSVRSSFHHGITIGGMGHALRMFRLVPLDYPSFECPEARSPYSSLDGAVDVDAFHPPFFSCSSLDCVSRRCFDSLPRGSSKVRLVIIQQEARPRDAVSRKMISE